MIMCCCFFFFFKQKTAYEMRISDWSSDVCSSDLQPLVREPCLSVGGRADDLFPRHHRAQARRAVGGQPARDPGGGRGAAAAGGKPGANRAPARNNEPRCAVLAAVARRRRPSCAERRRAQRSEEHTSEVQSLMRTSYAV